MVKTGLGTGRSHGDLDPDSAREQLWSHPGKKIDIMQALHIHQT